MAATAAAALVFPTTPNPVNRNSVEKRSRNDAIFLNKATTISAYRESPLSSSSAMSKVFIKKFPFRRRPNNRTSSFIKTFSPVMEWQDYKVKIEIDVPVSVAYNCYSDREAIPQWMPIISSVKGCREVLQRSKDLGYRKIIVESNSLQVISRLTGTVEDLSYFGKLTEGCLQLRSLFDSVSFSHMKHSGNHLILEDKPDLSRWSMKYNAFGHDIEFSWLARNMQPIRNQKIHWRSVEGLPNRGAVRFFPKGDSSCVVELTVSCEVPQILLPVASALQPFSEGVLGRGSERFAEFVKTYPVESAS